VLKFFLIHLKGVECKHKMKMATEFLLSGGGGAWRRTLVSSGNRTTIPGTSSTYSRIYIDLVLLLNVFKIITKNLTFWNWEITCFNLNLLFYRSKLTTQYIFPRDYFFAVVLCGHHHHKHQGLDPLIRSVSSYNCSRQHFFCLPIVLLPCGL